MNDAADGKELRPPQTSRPPRPPRRGRILRVKWGYNPNSSSMGSILFAVPLMLLAAAAVFGAAAGAIASAVFRGRNTGKAPPATTQPPQEGADP